MSRRKKIVIGCILSICIIVVAIFVLINIGKETPKLDSFNYNFYVLYINNSTIENLNVGPINDKETAISKAEQVWELNFGPEKLEQIRVNEKPYSVFYNPDKKMWLVQGHMEPNTLGGVASVIIGDNGKVYAAWHGK